LAYIDAVGRIWLERYQEQHEVGSPVEMLVLDGYGRELGKITLLPRSRLLDADATRVLIASRDTLDVDRVIVYPLACN
ncbi:MAG: hypothetical protein ACREMQ_02820, partial [Longimicrobiales bacterium]